MGDISTPCLKSPVDRHYQQSTVIFHQDFVASAHCDFLQGQTVRGILYWANHSWETCLSKQEKEKWYLNGKEATVNRALDGSMCPGHRAILLEATSSQNLCAN